MKLFVNLLVFLFLTACNGATSTELPSEGEGCPIFFDVLGVQDVVSRGLINDTKLLERACTPSSQIYDQGVYGGGQSIGLWADRTENQLTEYNILGVNTSLVYDKTKTGNPYNAWNYQTDTKLWKNPDHGVYKFRAYFPQNISVEGDASDATHFVASYNTATMQEDLLVAYKEVDASTFDLYTPVPLRFKHALAALRFQLKFKEGYSESDELTSLWLQNGPTEDFTYLGMMVFGLADGTSNSGDAEGIQWTKSAVTHYYHKMYHWVSDGVPFNNVGAESLVATAYTNPETSTTGQKFAQNDGWLLIIPQRSPGTVTMCFTTKKGGPDAVYSLKLPEITGTNERGEQDPKGVFYVPGYRYTYKFTLTETHADVTLGIAPWNELNASFDVPY